jgi:hypothetical protein
MRTPLLALLLAPSALLSIPATAQEQRQPELGAPTATPEEMLGQMDQAASEAEMQRLIAEAAAFPLGSVDNPVRVGGPQGERAYLARLRCSDGSAVRLGARNDSGVGAFGTVTGAYTVSCGGTTRRIVFDMYHEEHVENRAPPGFTIAG